jgi:hypothetical protein
MSVFRERYPYKRDLERFPPIKPEHAQAIGYVAAHWSFVEEALAGAISFLLQLPPTTRAAVTAEISTMNRMTIIRALVEASGDAELLSEWDILRVEIDRLRVRRNDVVHAVWEVVEPGHYAKRIKAKSKLKIEFGPVPTDELMHLSAEILELADKLVSFISGVIFSEAPKRLTDYLLPMPQNLPPAPPPSPATPKVKRPRALSAAQRRQKAREETQ